MNSLFQTIPNQYIAMQKVGTQGYLRIKAAWREQSVDPQNVPKVKKTNERNAGNQKSRRNAVVCLTSRPIVFWFSLNEAAAHKAGDRGIYVCMDVCMCACL